MREYLKRAFARWLPLLSFGGSQDYWQQRYRRGGDSGSGSSGEAARYKADVLNAFVEQQHVASVIEFGSGDGRQLQLATYSDYLGLDISPEAVAECRRAFEGDARKRFMLLRDYQAETAELTLSLDVMFHLVEDSIYHEYLDRLFAASTRYVAIYSTDVEMPKGNLPHVRHRAISIDVRNRFPTFVRMEDVEAGLPPPVEFSRGAPSRFLFYKRGSMR